MVNDEHIRQNRPVAANVRKNIFYDELGSTLGHNWSFQWHSDLLSPFSGEVKAHARNWFIVKFNSNLLLKCIRTNCYYLFLIRSKSKTEFIWQNGQIYVHKRHKNQLIGFQWPLNDNDIFNDPPIFIKCDEDLVMRARLSSHNFVVQIILNGHNLPGCVCLVVRCLTSCPTGLRHNRHGQTVCMQTDKWWSPNLTAACHHARFEISRVWSSEIECGQDARLCAAKVRKFVSTEAEQKKTLNNQIGRWWMDGHGQAHVAQTKPKQRICRTNTTPSVWWTYFLVSKCKL